MIKSHSGYVDGDGLSVTHVFEQSPTAGWLETATLEYDSGGNSGNFFIGQELAIDGGKIVIGYGPWSQRGSRRPLQFASRDANGWSVQFNEPLSLPLPDGFARSLQRPAGRTVDISGNFAIAEEPGVLGPGGSRGVARVYERSQSGVWNEVANLFPANGRGLGASSAAIDGTTAALVDRGDNNSDGGIYFFERQPDDSWVETQSFFQSPEEMSFFYFRMVEIDGDTTVTRDYSNGILTIYERIGGDWQPVDELSEFGVAGSPWTFALNGDLLAYNVTGSGDDPDRIEVLKQTAPGEWSPLTTVYDPKPELGMPFGGSLALDNGRLLVGAMTTSGAAGSPPGAAYLFELVPEPSSLLLLLSVITFQTCVARNRD